MAAKPLRILHLTLGADAGGLSRYILDLMAEMHAQGHQVDVSGDDGAWLGRFPFDHYLQIPLKGGLLDFRECVRTIRAELAKNPVDVIHTHYRRATLLARRLKLAVPIIYTLHLSHISLKWPRRWLTDFGDFTHCASLDAQQWLINDARVSTDRIALIPHGIDVNRFPLASASDKLEARREFGIPIDARVAVFVGRYDAPKNEQWILDVAIAIPGLHVIMIGEGPGEPALRQRIAEQHLEQRVMLMKDTHLLRAYQAADALMLPSTREGFSLVCAEAMSVGIPCLRTRTSGTHELIVENVTGRSTPIDRDAFVMSAAEFFADPNKLRDMGTAAAKLIRSNFTFEIQVQRTLELYRRVAKIK